VIFPGFVRINTGRDDFPRTNRKRQEPMFLTPKDMKNRKTTFSESFVLLSRKIYASGDDFSVTLKEPTTKRKGAKRQGRREGALEYGKTSPQSWNNRETGTIL
jgi:hypothetical protein